MRLFLAVGVLVSAALTAVTCGAGGAADGESLPLILDLRPATRSAATQVRVEADGRLEMITWCPYAHRVAGVHGRLLSEGERQALRERLAAAGLRLPIRAGEPAGGEPDDLFTLRLGSPPTLAAAGPVAEAPDRVRPLLVLLEELAARPGGREETADAYLRSQPVEPDRLRRIRRRGMIRLLTWEEVPPPLRPALERSVDRPHEFVAVEAATAAELLPLTSHGHELFVVDGEAAHQVGVFSAAGSEDCSAGDSGAGSGPPAPGSSTPPPGAEAPATGG